MQIIFQKGQPWHQSPQGKQISDLLASKGRMFCFMDEKWLNLKTRKCYPRGSAFIRLEKLEMQSQKRHNQRQKDF